MEACQYMKAVLTSATNTKAQPFYKGTKLIFIHKNNFSHLEKPQFCFSG